MVKAVHGAYIAGLSLVRINILSKPLLRPGWRQVLQYKCTEAGVQFTSKVCLLQVLTDKWTWRDKVLEFHGIRGRRGHIVHYYYTLLYSNVLHYCTKVYSNLQ